jgi:hypothetical protein
MGFSSYYYQLLPAITDETWLEAASYMQLQVDQHVQHLELRYPGQEEFIIGRRLARKAVRPKGLILDAHDRDGTPSAMTALLATRQHHQLFERVQSLKMTGRYSKELLQVSTERLIEQSQSVPFQLTTIFVHHFHR